MPFVKMYQAGTTQKKAFKTALCGAGSGGPQLGALPADKESPPCQLLELKSTDEISAAHQGRPYWEE